MYEQIAKGLVKKYFFVSEIEMFQIWKILEKHTKITHFFNSNLHVPLGFS